MEPIHVLLEEWPYDRGPGGWVTLVENRLEHWVVTRIHAFYEAPDGIRRGLNPWGKPIEPDRLHAYLVDLDGSHGLDLPDMERVLLHQQARKPHWWIKHVDDDYLAGIEQYKVSE